MIKRRKKRISTLNSIDKSSAARSDNPCSLASRRSFISNPAFQIQGDDVEETWLDSNAAIDYDEEEDFHSIQDDTLSLSGIKPTACVSSRPRSDD